jgi:hypothetical protein
LSGEAVARQAASRSSAFSLSAAQRGQVCAVAKALSQAAWTPDGGQVGYLKHLEFESATGVSIGRMSLRFPDADAAVVMVHDSLGQRGPMSRRVLAEQVLSGAVEVGGHFWYEGLSDWLPLSDHPGLLQEIPPAAVTPLSISGEDETLSAARFGEATLNPDYESLQDMVPDDGAAWNPGDAPFASDQGEEAASTQPILDARASGPGATSGDWADFKANLEQTWTWDDEWRFSNQVDEVFIGALIASTLNNSYSLMEISSDGTHHHLRFEHVDTASRLVCRVTYLTDTLPVAKVLGHRASVIFGYGEPDNACAVDEPLADPGRFGLEGMPAPGTLVIRRDERSDYVYAKVELTLDISRFVHEDYSVSTALLSEQIQVIIQALEAYLRHRAS